MAKSKQTYTIGIDIGGTKMNAILYDGEKIIATSSLATPTDTFEHFMIMLKAVVEPILEKAKELKVKVAGIGLGVAGVIDYELKTMLESPNIKIINNTKLGEEVEKMFELPVKLDNDGNCFVRAEAVLGAGLKHENVYGLVIGTGIGGGWYLHDDVYRVPHGGSGEPGEMLINFETGLNLEDAYHKLMQGNPAQMAEEAYRGDVLATKTYDEVGNLLGVAIANIVNLIAPEIIVIGGGVIDSGDLFLSRAKKTMREHIASDELKKRVKIVKSKLGENAGAIGAALMVE